MRTASLAAALSALTLAACEEAASSPPASASASASASAFAVPSASASALDSPSPSAEPEPVELLAAGDIADCSMAGAALTSQILAEFPDATIAVLGDHAYPAATAERFDSCFDPTWGPFVDRTRPAIGNHDLDADAGAPYYATFGDAVGMPGEGWYSYELGSWHVVVLNSNCDRIGCESGSAQHRWLVADLEASEASCILAYFHHPRFTSGPHGDDPRVGPFWSALADARADLVLVGHDHHYERFAPLSPDASGDPDGIRQFIVGTGGAIIRPTVRVAPGSEVIVDDAWGVLRLTLSAEAYAWSFLTVDRGEADAGSGECHD
ncbi:MAG TPA: metallophosphoesterase [Candidatus Limnocylindria bacterium]